MFVLVILVARLNVAHMAHARYHTLESGKVESALVYTKGNSRMDSLYGG